MKKIFMLVITLCLIASAFCIVASAEGTGAVIEVKYDSETKTFDSFEDGWNHAMEQANDGKEVYATLLTDWIAEDKKFSDDFFNGDGFDNDTIYFADDVKVTLDLGGHTIDRGLTIDAVNGEVMFINDDAEVTIKNGTIKGGYSSNGAGGIHIEGAKVSLIDLVITDNHVMSSNGSAIQHDGGGELYMKNCLIVDNDGSKQGLDTYGSVYLDSVDKVLIEDCYFADVENIDYGAGIYADECTDFVIKNCTFENLNAGDRGGAIWVGGEYSKDGSSKLYIYNCKFNNNTCGNYGGAIYSKTTELYVYDSEFKGNYADWDGGAIYLNAGNLYSGSVPSYFYRCTFDGNRAGEDGGAICCDRGMSIVTSAMTYGCDFINNSAGENGGAVCTYSDCGFGFFSDAETGKAATMKNNSAGELGGGYYQGLSSFDFGGEIYVSGNVSSAGKDDIRIRYGTRCEILNSITSPDGSIGIYYEDVDGGQLAEWIDESITVNSAAFFFNNAEFDLEFTQNHRETADNNETFYRIDLVEKTDHVASIIGEGSITTIIALVSLIVAAAAIWVCISSKKKSAAVSEAKAADESEPTESSEQ